MEGRKHIAIFSKRQILPDEELCYDYKVSLVNIQACRQLLSVDQGQSTGLPATSARTVSSYLIGAHTLNSHRLAVRSGDM